MHFVVNICFSFFSIHWFFHRLCPRMLLSSLMKLLYSLRLLTLFLHCCQSLLYSCTFSMQKLFLISDRSIKSSGIFSPDGTMSDLTSLPDHEELIVALVLTFCGGTLCNPLWLNSGQLFTRKRFVANPDSNPS